MTHADDLSVTVDWLTVIFDTTFMARLDVMAAKRFVQTSLAEEATTVVIEVLSDNNWQRLSSFAGKSKPETFAYAVASRVMEDFARKKFGRPRPPQWLQAQGAAWIKLWRMLCLERQCPELIEQRLANDFQDGFVVQAMRTIKQRLPNCGEVGFSEQVVDDIEEKIIQVNPASGVDSQIQQVQYQQAMSLLSMLLSKRDDGGAVMQDVARLSNAGEALQLFHNKMRLSDDDRLLLSLSYEDGLSSRHIAQMLNVSAVTVQRRLKLIRRQLADIFEGLGLADAMREEVGVDE